MLISILSRPVEEVILLLQKFSRTNLVLRKLLFHFIFFSAITKLNELNWTYYTYKLPVKTVIEQPKPIQVLCYKKRKPYFKMYSCRHHVYLTNTYTLRNTYLDTFVYLYLSLDKNSLVLAKCYAVFASYLHTQKVKEDIATVIGFWSSVCFCY